MKLGCWRGIKETDRLLIYTCKTGTKHLAEVERTSCRARSSLPLSRGFRIWISHWSNLLFMSKEMTCRFSEISKLHSRGIVHCNSFFLLLLGKVKFVAGVWNKQPVIKFYLIICDFGAPAVSKLSARWEGGSITGSINLGNDNFLNDFFLGILSAPELIPVLWYS